ncbi:MAG: hypothetical protein NC133_04500 [Prevotella sp.]|nr:hypothetical protein [Prevotella sp.]
MTLIKRLGVVSLILLLTASIILDVGYICYSIFNKDFTTGINNIGKQDAFDVKPLDPEDEDDPRNHEWFIEAQYYSNENNNGIELQEIKFNSFSAPTMLSTDRKRQVMQYVGNVLDDDSANQVLSGGKKIYQFNAWERERLSKNYLTMYMDSSDDQSAKDLVAPMFNYYSTMSDDIYADWEGLSSSLSRGTEMIVRMDDEAYMIRLNGSAYAGKINDGYIFFIPIKERDSYFNYLYGAVFHDIMSGIATNSVGEGTFYTVIDLSKYFTVTHHYDAESKRWEDVSNDADKIFVNSAIKFTYSKDGAQSSRESLAHIINGDPTWNVEKYDYNTDYWQERVKCTLTAKDLEYRYSETLGGYLVSMPLAMKNNFKNMPKLEVTIDLDLNNQYLTSRKINLVGLDYNAFENLRLNTLVIRGSGNFTCLENSLNNTYLATLKRSAGLTLIKQGDVINTEYMEVIL